MKYCPRASMATRIVGFSTGASAAASGRRTRSCDSFVKLVVTIRKINVMSRTSISGIRFSSGSSSVVLRKFIRHSFSRSPCRISTSFSASCSMSSSSSFTLPRKYR